MTTPSPAPRTRDARDATRPLPTAPNAVGAPAVAPAAADPHAADDVAQRIEDKAPRPSMVQLTGSALAAITSTVCLSYFGVAGTVIGAAVASIITVLGNFVYQRSMLRAQHKVAAALRTGARLGAGTPAPSRVADSSAVLTAVLGPDGAERARAAADGTGTEAADAGSGTDPLDPQDLARRPHWRRRLVVMSVGLFVALLTVITGFELVTGKPLTDFLHGTDGSGTSISHVSNRGDGASVPGPADTSTPTQAPTSGSDPEPTSDPTNVPTEEPTSEPTQQPTSDPTSSPTDPATTDPDPAPSTTPTGAAGGSGAAGESESGESDGGTDASGTSVPQSTATTAS
ncbi:hypothetical protein [Luteimicrobium subarcticum]|uniref:Uncharacterized protein n=1 Tax=Luteimicrobium subarcticum TaxID=620910 RepID=A0A2M8WRU9_9MICO|nr:hypothetical protein [Luteimicrobium subarcticum]PJI93649.1 hypothetical protein CLV34_1123 [Luteimicrobium subarcticum]